MKIIVSVTLVVCLCTHHSHRDGATWDQSEPWPLLAQKKKEKKKKGARLSIKN